jgi:hypothetical protein
MWNRYGDKILNRMGTKCIIFMSFVVSVFDFFGIECNVVVLIIHNISYTTISIKVITDTIVKCDYCD